MKNILLITGGSKGIGKGIVHKYLESGYEVYSFSRTKNAEEEYKTVHQIEIDLQNLEKVENIFQEVLSAINPSSINRITLINNAGTLGHVDRIENIPNNNISDVFSLNTFIPIHLTTIFIKKTLLWRCSRNVLNISSGAAENAKYGWSIYCASKAALNLFTQSVAKEQDQISNGINIKLIYPGVVDTAMQFGIRQLSKTSFHEVERFIEFKDKSMLNDIYTVGVEIYNIDLNSKIGNGEIIRIIDKR